jgi:hypothetical protein
MQASYLVGLRPRAQVGFRGVFPPLVGPRQRSLLLGLTLPDGVCGGMIALTPSDGEASVSVPSSEKKIAFTRPGVCGKYGLKLAGGDVRAGSAPAECATWGAAGSGDVGPYLLWLMLEKPRVARRHRITIVTMRPYRVKVSKRYRDGQIQMEPTYAFKLRTPANSLSISATFLTETCT